MSQDRNARPRLTLARQGMLRRIFRARGGILAEYEATDHELRILERMVQAKQVHQTDIGGWRFFTPRVI